jgi:hypothetical protein
MLGVERPEIALGDRGAVPRIFMNDTAWLVVPAALMRQPDPVQTAALVLPLVRLALGVSWIVDMATGPAVSLLCGAARLVVPGYAAGAGVEAIALADEAGKRLGRALGRKQKKALADLAPALRAADPATARDVQTLARGVHCAALRAAFVVTGDVLATLEAARAHDEDLACATTHFGPGTLRAVLTHALTGDLVRFAFTPTASALRWDARTLWNKAR